VLWDSLASIDLAVATGALFVPEHDDIAVDRLSLNQNAADGGFAPKGTPGAGGPELPALVLAQGVGADQEVELLPRR
jgi:hypothetical protein